MDSSPEDVDFEEEQSEEQKSIFINKEDNKDTTLESELVLEIFSHLPPKTELIFTSKDSRSCRANTANLFAGFFLQSKLNSQSVSRIDNPLFLPIKGEEYGLPDPSLVFLKQKGNNDVVELIDSCNGLLLCSNTTWPFSIKTCYVCNPFTKESIVVPHPQLQSNRVYYALIADLTTTTGYLEYKVVCVFSPEHGDPCSKLSILSSETGEWEEISEKLPVLVHESMMGSKVFINGSFFWDCLEGHILICHLNVKKSQRCYELIEAPRAPLGRCLWNLKDELLMCYCHGFSNEFPVWSLCFNDDKTERIWKAESCEEFEMLTEDICTQYTENWQILKAATKPRIRFRVLAWIPEYKKMFLWIPDGIYSYEFRKRKLEYLCGYSVPKFNSPSVALPYFHSLAPIQIGKIAEEKERRGESQS